MHKINAVALFTVSGRSVRETSVVERSAGKDRNVASYGNVENVVAMFATINSD